MTLRSWEYPHDDEPATCACNTRRDSCPEHLTSVCDGCAERFEDAKLVQVSRTVHGTFGPRLDRWWWCAACASVDAFAWRETERRAAAAIGVWLPEDLRIPMDEDFRMAREVRRALADDLDVRTRITWAGPRVFVHTVRGRLVLAVEAGFFHLAGAARELLAVGEAAE